MKKIKRGLWFKLALGFGIIILISALGTIIAINIYTRDMFTQLVYTSDIATAEAMAPLFGEFYEYQGGWLEVEEFLEIFDAETAPPRRGGKMGGKIIYEEGFSEYSNDNMMPRMHMRMMGAGGERIIITDTSGIVIADSFDILQPDQQIPGDFQNGIELFDYNDHIGYIMVGSMAGDLLTPFQEDFLNGVTHTIIVTAVLAAIIALVISSFIIFRLTLPLQDLSKASTAIAGGDFSVRVKPMGQDEIAHLSSSFNVMAKSLADEEERRKRLISDTAHELRTPVSLLRGNLEMILDGIYPPSEDRIKILYDESLLLSRLIGELHELYTYDNKSIILEKESINIEEIAQKITKTFDATARERDISLTLKSQSPLPAIQGDKHKLYQIFTNILSNAFRYTPDKGSISITITAEKDNKSITVSTTDTGPGIPEDKLEKIFERFYRIEESRNRSEGGRGLGLSICKEIIEAHGGTIYALPAGGSQKNGATIEFVLPGIP